MRKVYYIYNPKTRTYDRIYPTMRQRMMSYLRRMFVGMGLGAGFFIVLLIVFGSPSEKNPEKGGWPDLRKSFQTAAAYLLVSAPFPGPAPGSVLSQSFLLSQRNDKKSRWRYLPAPRS